MTRLGLVAAPRCEGAHRLTPGDMAHRASDNTGMSPFTLPATPLQTRLALAIGTALLAGLGVSAPFADTPLPRIDAFIPTLEGAVVLTDLITSVLLFSQSTISHSPALLALASGYLFTALIVVPHVLTFPGAFSPTGLFGAGPQTAGWLYLFWHLGLAAAIVIYACLNDKKTSTPYGVAWSMAIVGTLVCLLTLLVTAGQRMLPDVFLDATHLAPLARYVLVFNLLICAAGLVLLLISNRRSALDQWLIVVTVALVSELVVNGLLVSARFTLGWYISRVFTIGTSTIVLAILLEQTVMLYGRAVRSNTMLLRERNNRLMNLEALAASIAHEVKQPLTTITANGAALRRFLGKAPPELEMAASTAARMIAASHRIGEILDDIRNLFGRAGQESSPVDVNDLIHETLRLLDKELKDNKIATRIELTSELSAVMGLRGQMREVIINLIQNAIEAMEAVEDERRSIHVRTERYGNDFIKVSIADTGPGIDPKKVEEIFEAFVTRKSRGMGLGLAICRMIIERHNGQLFVSPASPHGAIFQILLPQMNRANNLDIRSLRSNTTTRRDDERVVPLQLNIREWVRDRTRITPVAPVE